MTMVSDKLNHIGVYKTDVEDRAAAKSIVDTLQRQFRDYDVSFDFEDCDKVLRIESMNGPVDESALVLVFEHFGYNIEQLP